MQLIFSVIKNTEIDEEGAQIVAEALKTNPKIAMLFLDV